MRWIKKIASSLVSLQKEYTFRKLFGLTNRCYMCVVCARAYAEARAHRFNFVDEWPGRVFIYIKDFS